MAGDISDKISIDTHEYFILRGSTDGYQQSGNHGNQELIIFTRKKGQEKIGIMLRSIALSFGREREREGGKGEEEERRALQFLTEERKDRNST